MRDIQETGLGIIAGAAVGDALGAPLEFLPPRGPDDFVTEMVGGGLLRWKPGDITDDTIMALGIMEMYLEHGCYNQNSIITKWLEWKASSPKDIGNWTHKALSAWEHPSVDRSITLSGVDNPALILWQANKDSAGNGAVMRCMPTAVARYQDEDLLFKESVWLAFDTHPDPRCTLSCVIINKLLKWGFDGLSKPEAFVKLLWELKSLPISNPKLRDAFEQFRDIPDYPWDEWENTGYTFDTIRCAMAAWMQYDSFEEGLIRVVNRGNDADTVGAVAGALLGAYHGFKDIPKRWWEALGPEMNTRLVNNTKGLLEIGTINT